MNLLVSFQVVRKTYDIGCEPANKIGQYFQSEHRHQPSRSPRWRLPRRPEQRSFAYIFHGWFDPQPGACFAIVLDEIGGGPFRSNQASLQTAMDRQKVMHAIFNTCLQTVMVQFPLTPTDITFFERKRTLPWFCDIKMFDMAANVNELPHQLYSAMTRRATIHKLAQGYVHNPAVQKPKKLQLNRPR